MSQWTLSQYLPKRGMWADNIMVGMRGEGGFFVGVVPRHGVKASFDGFGSRPWRSIGNLESAAVSYGRLRKSPETIM